MNINLQSEIFKQNLIELIANSNLPVVNIYNIIQLIQRQLEELYYETISKEKQKTVQKEQIENNKQEEKEE